MRRQVEIGPLTVGGGAPVRVESMLKAPLSDRGACLDQCRSLLEEGCELARVALPTAADAEGLAMRNGSMGTGWSVEACTVMFDGLPHAVI